MDVGGRATHGAVAEQKKVSFFLVGHTKSTMQKKSPTISDQGFVIKAWRCPTLTWGDPTLPLALSCFTSEFEMGSGGSNLLLPPDKLVEERSDETIPSYRGILFITQPKLLRSSETGKPRKVYFIQVLF